MSSKSAVVLKDWENREVIEIVEINIAQIVSFLNNFESTVRFQLSVLNEKLIKLENSLEHCEQAIKCSNDQQELN